MKTEKEKKQNRSVRDIADDLYYHLRQAMNYYGEGAYSADDANAIIEEYEAKTNKSTNENH